MIIYELGELSIINLCECELYREILACKYVKYDMVNSSFIKRNFEKVFLRLIRP